VKNPVVALVLSVILPGLGQAYNGQTAKAFVFFMGFFSGLYSVVRIDPLPFVFLMPFVYFWGLVDAFRSAEVINMKARGGAPTEEEPLESPAWGATLVVLGAVILASNLGWLSLARLHQFWPVLLIGFGLVFMWRSLLGQKSAS
jgi:TM2 domain-containing membrane protein YozV